MVAFAWGTTSPAVGAPDPAIQVRPDSAVAGERARVSLTGFDQCPVFGYSLEDPVKVTFGSPRVVLTWDGNHSLGIGVLSAGAATVTVTVPGQAVRGRHRITATCETDSRLAASRSLRVTEPVPHVVVPDLRGYSVAEAATRLARLGLVPGRTKGNSGLVARQSPAPYRDVPVGSEVDLVLEGAPPDEAATGGPGGPIVIPPPLQPEPTTPTEPDPSPTLPQPTGDDQPTQDADPAILRSAGEDGNGAGTLLAGLAMLRAAADGARRYVRGHSKAWVRAGAGPGGSGHHEDAKVLVA